MLIKIDILTSEDIDLIIFIRTSYISSYYTTFKLSVLSLLRRFIKQKVILKKLISILVYSHIIVSIKYLDL